jgi:hypothetical protein
MKRIFVIVFIFSPFVVCAQINKNKFPPKNYYKNAIIRLKDFTKLEAKELNVKTDTISIIYKMTFKNEKIPFKNIAYISVKEGNQALSIGISSGLLLGLSALISVSGNSDIKNRTGIVVGCTISGAALGSIIGLFIPQRKAYYFNNY